MKTRAAMALGATGLVVLGAVFMWKTSEPAAPIAAPAPLRLPPPVAAVATSPAGGHCRLQPGAQFTYGLTLESKTTQAAAGAAQQAEVSLSLAGQFEAEVLSVSSTSAVLVGKVALSPPPGKASIDVVALRPPFLLELDTNCQLLNFARQRSTPLPAARNQQGLLWETQFNVNPTAGYRMQDTNGVASGRLEREGARVRRTLERYDSVWAEVPPELKLYGVLVAELGDGPWFTSLTVRGALNGPQFSTSSTTSLELQRRAAAFTAAQRDASAYVWENLLPRQPKPELIGRPFTQFDRAVQGRVAAQTLPQAMDGFSARFNKGVGVQSTWPELSAYFEVHPDAVKPAISKYLKGELPQKAAGDFFLALSKARTPEAREALLEIKRDDSAVMMDQVRAMFALITREDVGHELALELSGDIGKQLGRRNKDADFLAGEAMLALSTMSGSRNDPAVAATSRQALESVLTREPAQSTNVHTALHAIGNTGDPALLAMLHPYATSADLDTRKAAAHVFSRMPPEQSDALEVDWLRRETSPFVKKELYRVIQQQHFNLQQGANRALVEQTLAELPRTKAAYTRKYMVLLISQSAVGQEPEIRRALVAQARQERARGTVLLNEFARILTRDEIAEVLR